LLIALIIGNVSWSQAPENFNYQAVIRDNTGELIINQTIRIRIAITNDINGSTIFYRENHSVATNNFGLVELSIGSGESDMGDFANIDWGISSKYLQVEIDESGSTNYIELGTFQLLSVPYALFANNADSSRVADMAYYADIAGNADIADSARISGTSYTAGFADFTNNASTADIANFADSARVSGMAYTANVAEVLGSDGVYSTSSDTLFVVKDHSGNVVFAVFPDGAQVIVNETAKGKVGGFSVSGRSPAKAIDQNIFTVTADSTRFYVSDSVNAKGKVGGFAVSGRSPAKGTSTDILFVTSDSTRIYVNEAPSAKGKVGGFSVSGRSPAKGITNDYLQVTRDSTRIYVTESATKGKVGGFAVSGRSPAKGITNDYLQVTRDSTRIYVAESATKGKVGGFAVSGRSPAKGTNQHMFITTTDSTRIFTQDTIGGFGVRDISNGGSISYMQLTPLNYFIGHESGQLVYQDPLNPGMGKYNTFFGYQAGKSTEKGYKNIFIGYRAGQENISGAWNIFIGNNAGASVTHPLSNIFIGDEAGTKITDGINNLFIGKQAGFNSTSYVSQDIFIGNSAGRSNINGGGNVYLGISAGYSSNGSENTFIGKHTGFSNLGSYNTFLGSESGIYTSSGSNNVCIGYSAGRRSSGSGNVFIGYNANNTGGSTVSYSNCIAVGDGVLVSGNNQIRIGNSSATSFYATGIYSSTTANAANLYMYSSGRIVRSTSSKRYKKDISPLEINTSDIYKLNPVSFTEINDNKRHFGLIAEEVAKVIPELAEFAREKDVVKGSESEELIPDAVRYSLLSVLLLQEVKKHETTIQMQTGQINKLNAKNKDLELRLIKLEELILR